MTDMSPDSSDGSESPDTTPTKTSPALASWSPQAGSGDERRAKRLGKGIEGGSVDTSDISGSSRKGLGRGGGASGRETDDDEDQDDGHGDDNDDGDDDDDDDDNKDDDEDEDEDEEPKLKYARLTPHLGPAYRNGDATSSFLVAGDKMIIGTHKGNIHIIQLPLFQSLRSYHAHSASVTSVSISPNPPPLPKLKLDATSRVVSQATNSPLRPASRASETPKSPGAAARKQKEQPQPIPNVPSNNLHIATSSMDGNVCVQSLVDLKDVSLRNFARPVQAVALSPDYKNDRTYLSGGLAGQLVLTVGAPPGKSTSTTTGTAAAAASSWLGNVGLGSNMGKDTVLHSGEGTISSIKWSLSGKYVAFANEHGIWIWRTSLHLDGSESEDAWTRIEYGHVDRPQTTEWDTMARVWKARLEWIDESATEPDVVDDRKEHSQNSPALGRLKQQHLQSTKKNERLLIGWGGIIWLVNVKPGGIGVGRNVGERSRSSAEVIRKLRMDCIISGVSLYTQSLLLVLAHCIPEDEDEDEDNKPSTPTRFTPGPTGGIRRRQNNLRPELRLIDLSSETETTMESLTMSRFETLGSGDYHLGVLPAHDIASSVVASRGALETLAGFGTDMLYAAINPMSLFSSGASIRSKDSNDGASSSRVASTPKNPSTAHKSGVGTGAASAGTGSVHPNLLKPGIKIFIHSPYDCILATKRDLSDHYLWLLERDQYQQAWELIDQHPEIVSSAEKLPEFTPGTPERTQGLDDFYEETASVKDGVRDFYSSPEKEKRRVGELWVQELVEAGQWARAGRVCGKVLGSPERWEKWVWAFAGANRFDEIVDYIPSEPMHPPIPRTIYEVVLGHYIQTDKPRFRELLDRWALELFDLATVSTALENQIKYGEAREDSVEGGEIGRDWRIVMDSLARLHEANGRQREALKCYIKLQDPDSAMRLIKQSHLAEAVTDDIPGFITLRVPQGQAEHMSIPELEQATLEAVTLLVDEAQHGLVRPAVVVYQLQEKELNLYIYFYLRALWRGEGIEEHGGQFRDRLVSDSRTLVDDFADLAVHLFAVYDRPLLMDFLKISTAYAFEKATQECESLNYVPELVYLYSKTGQMKRALYLIIDRLGDVSQAIAFAKEQKDPDLWDDLLSYSMDKPRFIRGLLEEVGTAINPITLVRRIPEGLEIPGLREGLKHIMKEHEIQYSISLGVARVLRSEVAAAQSLLRSGQRRGVKFEVVVQAQDDQDAQASNASITDKQSESSQQVAAAAGDSQETASKNDSTASDTQQHPFEGARASKLPKKWEPGHCACCHQAFMEWETETLVGFTCSHVFHLTHLMEALYPGVPVDVDLFGSEAEDQPSRGYHVGPKVTRARLLRDRIRGGCPVCIKKEGAT